VNNNEIDCHIFDERRGRRVGVSRYRKPRTIIKRCWTRKALLHLIDGHNSTLYSGRLHDFIERRVRDGELGRAGMRATDG
jgi:hypothetical protein